MICSTPCKTSRAARAAPAPRLRTVRARAEESSSQPNKKDELNESAQGDMKYVLREDMSNLTTTPHTNPETLGEAAKDTLEPRVRELRGKKLSQGTSDFGAIMRFDGPAPELINSRLSMVGFVSAVGAELATHQTIFTQFKEAAAPILAVSLLVAIASFIPIVRGTKQFDDGGGEGLRPGFNLTNELINGRAAMLGIALLVVFEAGSKQALF